ncbi:acyl carrier protein [Actinopolyspora mortivallis]|uniref:acyl carrier protein n=1 Tax=Actinopolyspora mortivallis TaxID=33906 RepID=UPI0003656FAC|nr:acyl carrier protein [Actinopolyspora mortivallis]
MSLAEEIAEHVVEEFASDVSVDELEYDMDLLDSGVVDSLGLVRLVSWIGKRYEIDVDLVDVSPDNFRSVNSMCSFVRGFEKE